MRNGALAAWRAARLRAQLAAASIFPQAGDVFIFKTDVAGCKESRYRVAWGCRSSMFPPRFDKRAGALPDHRRRIAGLVQRAADADAACA
jgi:hypothetical protein